MVNNISHKKLYKQVMYLLDDGVFSHKEISVSNYSVNDFYDVLMSELLTNIRLVIENERINNMSSMGVDVCCRVIIETCALLEADKKGEFTDEQKKLFLLQYLATDIQKQQQKKVVHEELRALLKNPYDQLINEFRSIVGCDEETAISISNKYHVFLEYGGRKFPSFGGFIKRYLGQEYTTCRERLNVFIHPSFFGSKSSFISSPKIDANREKIINKVLTLGYQYLPPSENDSYQKTRWNDIVLNEKEESFMIKIENEFLIFFKTFNKREVWEDTVLEHDFVRLVVFTCIRKLCSVLIDCFLCESLDLNAQIMARAKAYLEMTSLLGVFFDSDDIFLMTKSFHSISLITYHEKDPSIHEILKKANKGKQLNEIEQQLYDSHKDFFAEWYDKICETKKLEVSKEQFVEEAPNSLTYYIKQDLNYRYRDLMKEMLNKYVRENHIIRELISDYDFSARLGHASAYKSKLKENKMFSLIPNLIHYLVSVLDCLSNVEEVYVFLEKINSIREEIEQDKKNMHNQELSRVYKKGF